MFNVLNGQLNVALFNNSSSGGDSAHDGEFEKASYLQNGTKWRRGAANFSIYEASPLQL